MAKAKADASQLIARHKAAAADKIAAAERSAIEKLRAKAASAAATSSQRADCRQHDAQAERRWSTRPFRGSERSITRRRLAALSAAKVSGASCRPNAPARPDRRRGEKDLSRAHA